MDFFDRGIVRVYDLLVIDKADNGSCSGVDIGAVSADRVDGFTAFAGARSGLLDDEDLRQAAYALEPCTAVLLVVYENSWAIPFVAAARDAGDDLVAGARTPARDVMDAFDTLETTS